MSYEAVIEAATNELKKELSKNMENLPQGRLTPELASQMTLCLQKAISSAAQVGYRTFLESQDVEEKELEVGGILMRQKKSSEKFF